MIKVIKKAAVYSLVAVSMNLLNGFTGLFSLGQAGFMLLGAYAYAVLCIPVAKRAGVYQQFEGGLIQFSLPETFANLLGDGRGTRRRHSHRPAHRRPDRRADGVSDRSAGAAV